MGVRHRLDVWLVQAGSLGVSAIFRCKAVSLKCCELEVWCQLAVGFGGAGEALVAHRCCRQWDSGSVMDALI